LHEAVDKKGYQWEALPDEAAREIINNGLELYVDRLKIEETKRESKELTERWRDKVGEIIDELI